MLDTGDLWTHGTGTRAGRRWRRLREELQEDGGSGCVLIRGSTRGQSLALWQGSTAPWSFAPTKSIDLSSREAKLASNRMQLRLRLEMRRHTVAAADVVQAGDGGVRRQAAIPVADLGRAVLGPHAPQLVPERIGRDLGERSFGKVERLPVPVEPDVGLARPLGRRDRAPQEDVRVAAGQEIALARDEDVMTARATRFDPDPSHRAGSRSAPRSPFARRPIAGPASVGRARRRRASGHRSDSSGSGGTRRSRESAPALSRSRSDAGCAGTR